MTDTPRSGCEDTREAHEQAIAKLSEALKTLQASGGERTRAEALFLTAQVIRHRIRIALIDAEAPSS